MAKTKLVIRPEQATGKGLCTIYVLYTNEGKNTYISTKEQIRPEYWDFDRCRVKESYPNHELFNEYLFNFRYEIERIKFQLRILGINPTAKEVKSEYLKLKTDNHEDL